MLLFDEVIVINILFIHQSSELYGSDKVLLLLCTELKKSCRYHPIIILPQEGPLKIALEEEGVEVHIGEVSKISRDVFSPIGLFKLLLSLFRGCQHIQKCISGREVAVVHSNTLAVLSGAVWALVFRKKHLWHVHEIILRPKMVSKIFPRLVYWLSDIVISNSSLTEQWLLDEQPSLKSRSMVIFNGLPPIISPTPSAVAAFRHSIGAKPDDIVLSLVGRVNHWKGQCLLIDSLMLLKDAGKIQSLKVAIVGNTVAGKEFLLTELQQKVIDAGLDSCVAFVPFLDNVWPVWFGSNIAIVPSTEPEPFGMVAIEAMAAGLPVIAAGHGGLLDIVKHESTGLLFEPGSVVALAASIDKLVRAPDACKEFGFAGQKRQASYFSLETQVRQTEMAYERVAR